MDERATLYARMRPRVCCSLARGKQGRWRIRSSARLLGLAAVLGKRAERRCVPLGPTAGHARLLGTETRWWEAPMLRSRVTELHYITPVANLGSIATHGVLSHNLAARLPHTSVALERVQDRRALMQVPRGPAITRLREPLLRCPQPHDVHTTEERRCSTCCCPTTSCRS